MLIKEITVKAPGRSQPHRRDQYRQLDRHRVSAAAGGEVLGAGEEEHVNF